MPIGIHNLTKSDWHFVWRSLLFGKRGELCDVRKWLVVQLRHARFFAGWTAG